MKNIKYLKDQNGLEISFAFIKSSISLSLFFALFMCSHSAYATITGPSSPAETSGTVSCAAAAGTTIQSVAADITLLQSVYSSDCAASLTITLINEGLGSSSTDCSWEYFRNYTINENSGAACNAILTVTVEHFGGDTAAPTGSYGPITGVNACLSGAPGFDAAAVAAAYTDNCTASANLVVALTNTSYSGTDCGSGWTVKYTFTVSDACNNTSSPQDYTVSGADGNMPTGSTTAGTTGTNACLGAAGGLFAFDATAAAMGYSDDCGSVTAVQVGNEIVSGTNCGWTVSYNFDIIDACGNTLANQSYSHTGSDLNAPTGTYGPITGIDACMSGAPAFDAAAVAAAYSDDCSSIVTASLTGTSASGGDCGWSVTYTFNVTDGCSNTATGETYTVSGSDMTGPTLGTQTPSTYLVSAASCDITVSAADIDAGAAGGTGDNCGVFVIGISNTGAAGAGNPAVTLLNGTDFDLSTGCTTTASVFLHVVDACGNETVSSAVTVTIGSPAGSVSFPAYADVTADIVGTDCNQNVAIAFPVVSTLCGVTSTPAITTNSTPPVSFTTVAGQWLGDFPLGTTAVTVTATDACGNTSSDVFNVTINDPVAPALTFCDTAPIVVNTTATTCDMAVTYNNSTATDNCDFNLASGLVVTFADGSAGNNIPANFPASYTASPTSGNQQTLTFSKGVTTITWTFMDNSGNTNNSCTRNVTVNDMTAPTVATFATDENLLTSAADVTGCPTTGTSLSTGSIGFGASFTVAGKAFTAPLAAHFSDNCTGSLSVVSIMPGSANSNCSSEYTVLWRFTDCGGLTADDDQKFTITDDTKPSLTGTAYTSAGTNACKPTTATFSSTNALMGYTDNCQAANTLTATLVGTPIIAGNNCSWTVTYNYSITDGCAGNTLAGLSYTDTGGDTTKPSLTGTAYTSAGSTTCKPVVAPAFNPANALMGYEDNCTTNTLTATEDAVSRVITGTNCSWVVTYNYSISDGCSGNELTGLSYTETGGDVTSPSLTGTAYSDLTVHDYCLFTASTIPVGLAWTQARAIMGYTDNCTAAGSLTATLTGTAITGTDCNWTVTYTYSISDGCTGNDATGLSYSHSGKSQTAPVIAPLQVDQTYPALSTSCDQIVTITKPTANTSQCGAAPAISIGSDNATVIFNDIGTDWLVEFPVGITTVTITAVDACNNMATNVFTVTIVDSSPAYFAGPGTNGCPLDIPLDPFGCVNPVSVGITATDNCVGSSVLVDVAYSGNPLGTPSNRTGISSNTITDSYFPGVTTVQLTATSNGGSSTCTFTVEVDASCATIAPVPCQNRTEVVTDDINTGLPLAVYQADITVESDNPTTAAGAVGNVVFFPTSTQLGGAGTIIPSGHNISFFGGTEVVLHPGFDAQLGSIFLADIKPCQD